MKKQATVYTPASNIQLNGPTYAEVLDWVVSGMAIRATKYVSKNHIIRATRKTYGKKILKGNIDITLTIGKPNYLEREYIKKVLKNEKFPLQGVIIKAYGAKKKKLTKNK